MASVLNEAESIQPLPSQSFSRDLPKCGNRDEFVLFDDTMRFDDSIPVHSESQMLSIDCETQVLEEANFDENLDTQVLDDYEEEELDDNDKWSDNTVVLNDEEDDDCEIGTRDIVVSSHNRHRSCDLSCEQSVNDFVVDSDTSIEKLSSGYPSRSFMSVRIAPLQASSNNKGRITGSSKTENVLSNRPKFVKEHLHEEDDKANIGDRASVGDRIRNAERDNSKVKQPRDKSASSVARKLNYEDILTETNGSMNDNYSTNRGKENTCPVSLASTQELPGLSYIDSQEPGEFSQLNALDVVDKFLLANDFELSEEVIPKKAMKRNTPLVSKAKGVQALARRSSTRSPVKDSEIFDWCNIGKDGEAEKYVYKRKKEDLGLGKKIIDSSCSDFRLLSNDSKWGNLEVEMPEVTKNNLDEKLKPEITDKMEEEIGTSDYLTDMYDVGFDTQMAAEAMEALLCAPPANHTVDDSYQVLGDAVVCSPKGVPLKKTRLKTNTLSKRHVSDDPNASVKSSRISHKSTRKLNMKKLESASLVKSNVKKGKLKGECLSLGRRVTKSVDRRKTAGVLERAITEGFNISCSSSKSNENLSLGKRQLQEVGTYTPIACRTRRSRAVKPLQGMNSSIKSGEHNMSSHHSGYSSCIGGTPLSSTLTRQKSVPESKEVSTMKKKMQIQQKRSEHHGHHEHIGTTSCELRDALSYHPKGKRTKRTTSVALNKIDYSDREPRVNGTEIGRQSATKRRRTKLNNKGYCVKQEMEKETQLLLKNLPSFSCLGKRSAGSLTRTNGYESNPADTLNSSALDLASRDSMRVYSRKTSSKNSLSKPLLNKELIRLGSSESASLPVLKDLRKRRDMSGVRVLFSNHLSEDLIKQQQKISSRLGVSIASSSSEATHFISDKFARTRNMLEAIALGKLIVTHLWLESCDQASHFIDEKNYIMRDPKKEKEIGFSMPVSLARARKNPLLQGKEVFITHNVQPSKELISSLVKAVNGQVVERIERCAEKSNEIPEDLLILSCEQDHTTCLPLLEKGAAVYSSELLLNGIVIQKLEYERHQLFTDDIKRRHSRSTRTR